VISGLLQLAAVFIAAILGGYLAGKVRQPAVLGELLAGVVMGNAVLGGFSGFEPIKDNQVIAALASFGALLLLFQVGLGATVAQMLSVGVLSLRVALLGVIGPFALGWGVGAWLLPHATVYAHIFLGATLTATSVGITARVLKDLGRADSTEARIILGASVIDDVLGLVILAVVVAVIKAADQGTDISMAGLVVVVAKAALFLFGSLAAGVYVSPRIFALVSRTRVRALLLLAALTWCGLLAGLAAAVGLAPIVGAFAAGLVLEDATLSRLIDPLVSVLAPLFFVFMGVRTDLFVFAQPGVLVLAAALTAAAILGKVFCGLGAAGAQLDRLTIGVGMVPRGEVGLIFANIGLTLFIFSRPVVDRGVFSAVVVMVMVTTLATPPALKWSFARSSAPAGPAPRPPS